MHIRMSLPISSCVRAAWIFFLRAERCCIELVFNNALAALYSRQLDNAKAVADAYERKFRHGDATRIECNKAALNLTNMENELKSES